jgi:outer membrane protein
MKKNIFTLILIALTLFPAASFAQTKLKIGHVNSNDLLIMMPERKTAETSLQTFAKSLEEQLGSMSNEYEKKLTEYQTNAKVMADPVREAKEEELADLERRIRDFQVKAQQSIAKKEEELMEPMIEKANQAINDVAKENGVTYVFDTASGSLLVFPDGDDILPLVKTKLGL